MLFWSSKRRANDIKKSPLVQLNVMSKNNELTLISLTLDNFPLDANSGRPSDPKPRPLFKTSSPIRPVLLPGPLAPLLEYFDGSTPVTISIKLSGLTAIPYSSSITSPACPIDSPIPYFAIESG